MVYRYSGWLFIFLLCCGVCVDVDALKRRRKIYHESVSTQIEIENLQESESLEKLSTPELEQENEVIEEKIFDKKEDNEEKVEVQEKEYSYQEESEAQVSEPQEVDDQLSPTKHYIVKVLLHSWPESNEHSVQLHSQSGFWLLDPENKSQRMSINMQNITIDTVECRVRLNEKKVARDHFYLIPKDGYTSYNGRKYQGMILVANDKKNVLIVNCVDLEDYICSVLKTESWPGWPLEVNKVFAITSRSYVMAMIQQARIRNSFYHVYDTNLHQTYTGAHTIKSLQDAVECTKGVFLAYEGKPILAMFDSCCGGIIPAHIADFNFSKTPYLARTYPCTYCRRCKIYQWKVEYNRSALRKIFKSIFPHCPKFKKLSVSKKDKAGLVQQVILEPGLQSVSGKKLYSLLNGIKSFCFTIERKKKKFVFTGKGFGHHLGLCQWGAYEMVRNDWDYKRILHFYYPGTKLVRLT